VNGRLKQRQYETKDGEKRTVYEIEAEDIGPSLRNASAKVIKAERSNAQRTAQSTPAGQTSAKADAWTDEPPF
jgi:single-strand DNA-binding protein